MPTPARRAAASRAAARRLAMPRAITGSVHLQDREERLLRDVHLAHHLHPLLARRFYAPGIGLVQDPSVKLVRYGKADPKAKESK